MPIVGFNFTKILVERKAQRPGKISISNNIAIKKVEAEEFTIGTSKQKGLRFEFEFKSTYKPNVGQILLNGIVLFIDKPKKVEEVLKVWKKEKKVPKDIGTAILNTALNRCNIQAIVMSKEINLPSPIPLPRIKTRQQAGYIG